MSFAAAALALFALPAPAAAPPDDACGAIARIAAAARERPSFGSLGRALADGQAVVPGFTANECSASDSGIDCREAMHRGVFQDWPDLASCAGVVEVEPPPLPRPQLRYPTNMSYRLGPFRIERWLSCPACAALGPAHFTMRLERP